jgi:hypothetical protein
VELEMTNSPTFDGALEAVEQLDVEAQLELIAVLNRRLAERGRNRIAASVVLARKEFDAGQCQPMTAEEIVREAQS